MLRLFSTVLLFSLCLPATAQVFEILRAEYGAGATRVNVTEKLRSMVRGNGLEFTLDSNTLEDPLPGVEKTLTVRFAVRNRIRTQSFRDHERVRLGSPSSAWTPETTNPYPPSTNFPSSGSIFGPDAGAIPTTLTIYSARYGDGRRWADVTKILQDNIRNNTLRLAVSNEALGGDPAPATQKYLEVDYAANGQRRTERFEENQSLQIINGVSSASGSSSSTLPGNQIPRGPLEILSARYGTLGTNVDVLSQLRRRVQGGRLQMSVSPSMMGQDPSGRNINELLVEYTVGGQRYTKAARDGETIQLP
ncbi:MAG: hypothetical protein OHK0021_19370 [Bryobacter sp.]